MVPTLNLVEAIRIEVTKPHVVFASSGGAIYGPASAQSVLTEDSPCAPASSYGIQKLAMEHYLRLASERGWLTATALRIGNPYGVLLPPERRQGFIGVAVNHVLQGMPVRVFGNPDNVRDYVHLSDVACAFDAAVQPRAPYAAYNIGSGTGHSVRDILALIEQALGRHVPVVYARDTQGADQLVSWNVLDVRRAARELGWAPRIALDDGLRDLLHHQTG
jgi:UDP-glucose 4-epimerase